MTSDTTVGKLYCNCLAMERGLDPVGHGRTFEDAIVIETPLPWKIDMTQRAGLLPQPVIDLMALWLKRYYAGEGYPHLPLVVAPDPEYSIEGFRRVMFYSRPAGSFSQFKKAEYLIPEDQLGDLAWSLYEERDALPQFEPYRVPENDALRDILICTHGTVDAACAKFGYPLYRYMRDHLADDTLRLWRVSHFGGHVFAPTLMDMPLGHYWAYVGKEQANQIVHQQGDVSAVRGNYRGWAGVADGFVQAAECELWQRFGWEWFTYQKSGEIIVMEDAEQPQWADVRIRYSVPGAHTETTVEMRVEVTHAVETETTTGRPNIHSYAQYRVADRKEKQKTAAV